MKKPDDSSRARADENGREARLAEALRANLRRRKAFGGKTPCKPDLVSGPDEALTEKPNG